MYGKSLVTNHYGIISLSSSFFFSCQLSCKPRAINIIIIDDVHDKLDDILDGLEEATSTINEVEGKLEKNVFVTKDTRVPFGGSIQFVTTLRSSLQLFLLSVVRLF